MTEYTIMDVIKAVCGKRNPAASPYAPAIAKAYKLVEPVYMSELDYHRDTVHKKAKDTNPEVNYLQHRLYVAHLIATNMHGTYEDVINSLLAPAFASGKLSQVSISDTLGPSRCEAIKNLTSVLANVQLSRTDATARDARDNTIDNAIFESIISEHYLRLCRNMNRRCAPMAFLISNAYQMAYDAHKGVCRASGEPYIMHPLCVAHILAEMGVESEIVAAALLHDVVEDSDYTLADISGATNPRVAAYVNAVTSVDREYFDALNSDDNADSIAAKDKESRDFDTVQKLAREAASDDSMIFALYIKAADRMHNLMTLGSMKPELQVKKVTDTRDKYLPLFKACGINYFVEALENLCYMITNPTAYDSISERYESLLEENEHELDRTFTMVKKIADKHIHKTMAQVFTTAGYCCEVKQRTYSPHELCGMVRSLFDNTNRKIDELISKKNITLMDIEIIVDGDTADCTLGKYVSGFVKTSSEAFASTQRVIVDYHYDSFSRFTLVVEDQYHNNVRIVVMMRDDYVTYRNGSLRGASEVPNPTSVLGGDYIVVSMRNRASMKLPCGATVLDFAFAIHEEVGFTAKNARVNGIEVGLYTILNDGDHVVVNADTRREDSITCEFIPHVRIDWLNHVKTDVARRKITLWLEELYEGNNPRTTTNAQPIITNMTVDQILAKNIEALTGGSADCNN